MNEHHPPSRATSPASTPSRWYATASPSSAAVGPDTARELVRAVLAAEAPRVDARLREALDTTLQTIRVAAQAAMGVLATTSPAEPRRRSAPPKAEPAETPSVKAHPPASPRRPAGRISPASPGRARGTAAAAPAPARGRRSRAAAGVPPAPGSLRCCCTASTTTGLAQASYLIGCERTGEALVIDPNRDVEQYLEAAAEYRLRITHVTETHIHADFVSGSRELAERTGRQALPLRTRAAATGTTASPEDGAVAAVTTATGFEVGNVRVHVLHTPGHTPEHLTFLVTDGAARHRADRRR